MNFPVPWRSLVPIDAVPVITGTNGTTLAQICGSTNAVVEISGEGETPSTLSDKICTITGSVEQKEAACRRVVDKLRGLQDVADQEPGVFVIIVPSNAAPMVVGQKGAQIKEVIELSGAEIAVGKENIIGMNDQPIGITGTGGQVVSAVSRINAVLQDLADRGKLQPSDFRYRPGGAPRDGPEPMGLRPQGGNPRTHAKFLVATQVAGWIIGKQGRHIRELQENSGSHIQVLKEGEVPPGVSPVDRVVEIGGRFDARSEGIQIVLMAIDSMPALQAPRETQMLVPKVLSTPKELRDVQLMSGAELEVRELPGHDEALCTLLGSIEARVKAAQQFLTRIEEVVTEGAPSAPPARAAAKREEEPWAAAPVAEKGDPWTQADPWSQGRRPQPPAREEERAVAFRKEPEVIEDWGERKAEEKKAVGNGFGQDGVQGKAGGFSPGPEKMSFGPDGTQKSFAPGGEKGGQMSFAPDGGRSTQMSFEPDGTKSGGGAQTSFAPGGDKGNQMSFSPDGGRGNQMSFGPDGTKSAQTSFGPGGEKGGQMSFGPDGTRGNQMSFGPDGSKSTGGGQTSFAPGGDKGNQMSFGPDGTRGNQMSFGPDGTKSSGGAQTSFAPGGDRGNQMSFSPDGTRGNQMSFGPDGTRSSGDVQTSFAPGGDKGNQMSFAPDGNKGNQMSFGPDGTRSSGDTQTSFAPSGDKGNQMSFGPDGTRSSSNAQTSFGPGGDSSKQMSFGPDGTRSSGNMQTSFAPGGDKGNQMSFGPDGTRGSSNMQTSFAPGGDKGNQMSFGPDGNKGNQMSFGQDGTRSSGNMQTSFGPGGDSGKQMSFGPDGTRSSGNMQTSFAPGGDKGNQMSFGPDGTQSSGNMQTSFAPGGDRGQTSFGPDGTRSPSDAQTSFGPNKTSFGPDGAQSGTSFAPDQTSFGPNQSQSSFAPCGSQTSFGPFPMNPMACMGGMGMGMMNPCFGMGMMSPMNPMAAAMNPGVAAEVALRSLMQASSIGQLPSQLLLLLPVDLVRKGLAPQGHLAEVATRCQVRLDLGMELNGSLQVCLTGPALANAMAAYLLQERAAALQGDAGKGP